MQNMQNYQPTSEAEAQQLADMFAHHMSLSAKAPTPPPDAPINSFQNMSNGTPSEQKPIFPSAHYTHSRHVVPIRFHPTPSSSPRAQPLSDIEAFTILADAQIHPSTLTAEQFHLFQYAIPEQRLRLLQLWSISPSQPQVAAVPNHQSIPGTTSFQWDVDNQRATSTNDFGLSNSPPTNNVAPFPRPSSAPEVSKTGGESNRNSSAEPYMMSGYELLARKEYEASMRDNSLAMCYGYSQATDPAWAGAPVQMGQGNHVQQQYQDEDMELWEKRYVWY